MKVLHVIETLDFGGAEAVVVDLVGATLDRCEPVVCCIKHRGELAARLDPRVPVLCLDKKEGIELGLPWRLARLIREQSIDVVHSHLWGAFLESAVAAKLAGLPLIHTVHGTYPKHGSGLASRMKLSVRRLLERQAGRWHRRVVTVSRSIEQYVVGAIGLDGRNVETVHNGIAERSLDTSARNGRTFITVGRMAAVKNQALMLRAFARVAAQVPEAHLRLVGDGPERPALEALSGELGLTDQVEFLGFRNDAADLMAQADVFLMSSHYEGISIAILEAMRAGLAVIGTRVGGIPETVEHRQSGLLVDDNDEAGFAAAMLELLQSHELRQTLGQNAAARQRTAFSLESAAQRYLALYGQGA